MNGDPVPRHSSDDQEARRRNRHAGRLGSRRPQHLEVEADGRPACGEGQGDEDPRPFGPEGRERRGDVGDRDGGWDGDPDCSLGREEEEVIGASNVKLIKHHRRYIPLWYVTFEVNDTRGSKGPFYSEGDAQEWREEHLEENDLEATNYPEEADSEPSERLD